MKIRVFTDGACSGNPGPGGWAAIVHTFENMVVLKGYETNTTNNRMELMAVVEAAKKIVEGNVDGVDAKTDKIEIHSDSAYVVNAINDKWTSKWKLNGWKTTKGNDVKNKDLWEMLISLLYRCKKERISIRFVKVKGHTGDPFNEMADKIAVEQSNVASSFNR